MRHSGCRHITLGLLQDRGSLRLEVADDGTGGIMPEGDVTGHAGLGLLGMQERARRIGGRLEVHSPQGGPTRITLVVPAK